MPNELLSLPKQIPSLDGIPEKATPEHIYLIAYNYIDPKHPEDEEVIIKSATKSLDTAFDVAHYIKDSIDAHRDHWDTSTPKTPFIKIWSLYLCNQKVYYEISIQKELLI